MTQKKHVWLGAALAALALAACSGGQGGGSGGTATHAEPAASGVKGEIAPKPTAAEAARFLTQATFGATDDSIAAVQASDYSAWIAQQMAMPVSASHQAFVENRLVALQAAGQTKLTATEFYESFWSQAATAPDQLRQRVKLALSEIFVISLADPTIDVSAPPLTTTCWAPTPSATSGPSSSR